jgi:SAM-dependent methyltransferase
MSNVGVDVVADARRFWRDHDQALALHRSLRGTGLSHDLYRGMPPWFNAYYAHFQRRAVVRLLRQCGPLGGMRALDVGCGTGRWSELLACLGAWPVGVDLGLAALQLGRARQGQRQFCAGALPDLGFADAVFDLVVSVTVLQHVPRLQQEEAIAELARVLRAGGWLVVCESVDPSDPASHVFGNPVDIWRAMFAATGLRQVDYIPCEHLPYIRLFQRARAWVSRWRPAGSEVLDVSSVATALRRRLILSLALQMAIAVSYPIEYLASWLLPRRWARLGCFLLTKEQV